MSTKPAVVRLAETGDTDRIRSIVKAAYSKYTQRIGKEPAPMKCDFQKLILRRSIYVLCHEERIVGSIQLTKDGQVVHVNSVVVDPMNQGLGYGRQLMNYAEQFAKSVGGTLIALYTNEKMHENLCLYPKLGYIEVARKMEDGYNRVYFEKKVQ